MEQMEEMNLREYWEIIVKKKGIIALVFILTILAVAVYSLLATPIYEATTTVMVRKQGGISASNMLLGDYFGTSASSVQNYIEIIKSRDILQKTMREAGIIDTPFKSIEKRLSVQPIGGTEVLQVSMQSPDPEEAMNFANQLVKVFIDWNRLARQEDQRSARVFIESQLEIVYAQLELAEEALRSYRESERVSSPSEETAALLQLLTGLETKLADLTISRRETEERANQVRTQLAGQDETVISSTTIATNPFVSQYQAKLADLEISLSGAREKYTDRHPSVLALQAEIEDIKEKLAEQIERVIGTETLSVNPIHRELYGELIQLEVSLRALEARERAVKILVAEKEESLGELPAKELELARLMRDTKVLEELYLMLRTRGEEAKIAEAMQTADIQVIDEAILPASPVKPRVKLNIAIGGVLGIFLGVGLAFLLEFMDTTLKTKDEVEAALGLPVLGQIPDFDDSASYKQRLSRFSKGREIIGRK